MEGARKIVQMDESRPYTPKAKKKKQAGIIVLAVLIAAGAFMAFSLSGNKKIPVIKDFTLTSVTKGVLVSSTEASGTVVLPTQVSLVSPQEALADTILVNAGDSVTTSTVLATLDAPDLEDQKDDLTASLEVARLSLKELEATYTFSTANYATKLKRLGVDITEAEADVKAMKELAALRSSRQSDYENAVAALRALTEQKEDAETSLAQELQKRDIALEKQKATIRQLETNLNRTIADIAAMQIRSPIAGEVLSVNADLSVPGSLIEKNTELMKVADRTNAFIDFEVYEQYAGTLAVGGKLTATIGTSTVAAEITQIGKVASLSSDGLSATVSVRTKPLEAKTLTPGATAVATIALGEKQGVLLLPRGAWLTTGGQKYAYKVESNKVAGNRVAGDKAIKTAITCGEIQGTQVEILKGLSAGDSVITSGYQDFIANDEVSLK